MRNIWYLKAVSEALKQEMERDPEIIVMGEDVRQSLRGITRGFVDLFGEKRVIDTPISEAALVGAGSGAISWV